MSSVIWSEHNHGSRIGVLPAIDGEVIRLRHYVNNATGTLYTVPSGKAFILFSATAMYQNLAGSNATFINGIYAASGPTLLYELLTGVVSSNDSFALHLPFPFGFQCEAGDYFYSDSQSAGLRVRLSIYGVEITL